MQPFASVAVTVKLKVPVMVGVPLTVPVLESDIPAGSAPLVTAKVVAPTPPVCVIVVGGYASKTVPAGNTVAESVIVPQTKGSSRATLLSPNVPPISTLLSGCRAIVAIVLLFDPPPVVPKLESNVPSENSRAAAKVLTPSTRRKNPPIRIRPSA